jgi:hypothetical protein
VIEELHKNAHHLVFYILVKAMCKLDLIVIKKWHTNSTTGVYLLFGASFTALLGGTE